MHRYMIALTALGLSFAAAPAAADTAFNCHLDNFTTSTQCDSTIPPGLVPEGSGGNVFEEQMNLASGVFGKTTWMELDTIPSTEDNLISENGIFSYH